jgi:ABC-type Fe3+ transport system permease subunit
LNEEFRRLSRAQRLADYRLYCGLAVLLPVVYLGCLLRAGLETDHLWDSNMRSHPLELVWSSSMSFLR